MNEFKKLVEATGMKHKKIAEILGVPKGNVDSYVSGRRNALEWQKRVLRHIVIFINNQTLKRGH